MAVEFRVLGAVEAWIAGRPVDLGHTRQRSVLAVLLIEANQSLPADQLLDRVWGERVPRGGRATLYGYLSRLRRALDATDEVAILRRPGGYELVVDEDAVDVHRFRRLVAEARAADDDRAPELFAQALGLWRGEVCAGQSTPWIDTVRADLERQRFAAELDHIDVRLRTGRHTGLSADLAALAAAHPLDERVAGQFMLALYRSGRQADALEHYRRLRARLAEDLGADPGPPLQRLHRRILTADACLPDPTAVPRSPARSPVVPRQLPAVPRLFTGRATELAELDRTLTVIPTAADPVAAAAASTTDALAAAPIAAGQSAEAASSHTANSDTATTAGPAEVSGHSPATVVISAIGGAGGVGKTWLALAWANRHVERFPDGQLFVDLRGFSPAGRPMAPDEAVRGFLDALGVDPGRLPAEPDARAALYRSLVAGRRMLIVLDNAATGEQVAPLLPGSATCTVLVTSRSRLPALVARHGARPLSLDVLTDAESRALLVASLGAKRVAAEEPAVTELIALCGGFPLALGLIAARAWGRLPLGEIVAELHEFGLDALDDSDPAASLPAVLSWSLCRLTERQRTVFALLGIAPGPDIGLAAAADLTGLSARETRTALRDLVDASLLDRAPSGRYALHDLVRAYATTHAHDHLPEPVRRAALERVVDFYLHTAHTAHRLLDPHAAVILPEPPAPGVHPHPLPDQQAAMAWLDAEHPHLLAAQHTAAAHHRHHAVWHLAWNLTTYHQRRGHRHDEVTVWQAALEAAEHLPDPTTRIRTHRHLGRAHALLDRHEEATRHLHQGLALAEHHDDIPHQTLLHHSLAAAWDRWGDDRRALGHARRALDLCRVLGDSVREGYALNGVGWLAARMGEYDTGREHCEAALALFRQHGDRDGEAATLDSLGFIDHRTGRHQQAVHHYEQALTLFRALGDTYEVATTLDNLGHPHSALGQHDQARAAWEEALELYRRQDRDTDAERLRKQLDGLDPATDPDDTR
ncbi:AfsR/SARP family transcriptional regulator [Actinosynnema sp. CS-041913]|uniref:AfsR/SARP family transcriptional regulator n=1 Tax=Actinosynnema sp. CS-041913 TaxID=3239917 RepID=UPI003D9498F0